MKRRLTVSLTAATAVLGLMFVGAAPAQAAYAKYLPALSCGNQFPPREIHIKSVARNNVTHWSQSAVHGTMLVDVGTSPAFFAADSHHWLRYEIQTGYVQTSSNYSADIQSGSAYCT